MAMQGIWASFYLNKNIMKMQTPVNPKVRTLKVEKVSEIMSSGFVSGD
jgi:hypothetical protein